MIQVFPKFLILLLAMLQFVAPLVHAHTGNHNFSQGLHLPGLEPYLSSNDALDNQLVNSNNPDWGHEGLLVVVDAGIKNPKDIVVEIDHNHFTILTLNYLIHSNKFANDCKFSHYYQKVAFREHFTPISPRAPPVIVSYA